MPNLELLKNTVAVLAKNGGIAVADTISLGLASAVKNTIEEISRLAKESNDGLYNLQVQTFLETADLDQDKVSEFFSNNPDNHRLGLEVFKILENTYLEKQAKYIALAFKKYVLNEIEEYKLYQYIHVIGQFNRHVLAEIENDLQNLKSHSLNGLPRINDETSMQAFTIISAPRNQTLQSLGFILDEPKKQDLTFSGSIVPEIIYKRSSLYLSFYLDILEEEFI